MVPVISCSYKINMLFLQYKYLDVLVVTMCSRYVCTLEKTAQTRCDWSDDTLQDTINNNDTRDHIINIAQYFNNVQFATSSRAHLYIVAHLDISYEAFAVASEMNGRVLFNPDDVCKWLVDFGVLSGIVWAMSDLGKESEGIHKHTK